MQDLPRGQRRPSSARMQREPSDHYREAEAQPCMNYRVNISFPRKFTARINPLYEACPPSTGPYTPLY